jgi:hypothetical protein
MKNNIYHIIIVVFVFFTTSIFINCSNDGKIVNLNEKHSIRGVVSSPGGPLENIIVQLQYNTGFKEDITDSNGNFSFEEVDPIETLIQFHGQPSQHFKFVPHNINVGDFDKEFDVMLVPSRINYGEWKVIKTTRGDVEFVDYDFSLYNMEPKDFKNLNEDLNNYVSLHYFSNKAEFNGTIEYAIYSVPDNVYWDHNNFNAFTSDNILSWRKIYSKLSSYSDNHFGKFEVNIPKAFAANYDYNHSGGIVIIMKDLDSGLFSPANAHQHTNKIDFNILLKGSH